MVNALDSIKNVLPVGPYLIGSNSLSELYYLCAGHSPARKNALHIENSVQEQEQLGNSIMLTCYQSILASLVMSMQTD